MLEALLYSSLLMLIGGTIVFFFTRSRSKDRSATLPAEAAADSNQRLDRLENGMEAIALEIERISEGQRFVTRLLSESASPAAPAITQSVRAERPPNH